MGGGGGEGRNGRRAENQHFVEYEGAISTYLRPDKAPTATTGRHMNSIAYWMSPWFGVGCETLIRGMEMKRDASGVELVRQKRTPPATYSASNRNKNRYFMQFNWIQYVGRRIFICYTI